MNKSSKNIDKKVLIILFLFLGSLWVSPNTWGRAPAYYQGVWFSQAKKRDERFFDLDKDGYLNQYEWGLLTTHRSLGWPMANTRKKKVFDHNKDHMLGPFEWERYQLERKK